VKPNVWDIRWVLEDGVRWRLYRLVRGPIDHLPYWQRLRLPISEPRPFEQFERGRRLDGGVFD
jgi:hypothetical protein